MNALRTAAGTRPQRRRYLAMGWVLGAGAFALGATLADPFAGATGSWTAGGAALLVVLAAVAAYDGAGLPVTVAFVALVAAGLAPFGVGIALGGTAPVAASLAARVAFAAAVALIAGVALGVPGFLLGAGGRWVAESSG